MLSYNSSDLGSNSTKYSRGKETNSKKPLAHFLELIFTPIRQRRTLYSMCGSTICASDSN